MSCIDSVNLMQRNCRIECRSTKSQFKMVMHISCHRFSAILCSWRQTTFSIKILKGLLFEFYRRYTQYGFIEWHFEKCFYFYYFSDNKLRYVWTFLLSSVLFKGQTHLIIINFSFDFGLELLLKTCCISN